VARLTDMDDSTGGIRPDGRATGSARLAALAALALLVPGCREGGGPAAPGWTVRDSAGVRIATSTRPARSGAEARTVGDPSVTIGGGAEDDLFDVAGGVLLPDGGVALAVGASSEVRFYDAQGALRAAYGGRGDGPGEFRLLAGIGHAGGDTVWAWDFGAARASLLTATDGVVASVSLRPPLPAGVLVGRRSDGSLVVGQLWGSGSAGAPESEGLVRDLSAYARYAPDGALADTLGLFPGREVLHRLEGRRMTMGVAPFARAASHALVGDDLIVGDQVDRELTLLGRQGPVRIRWSGPPLDVTAAEVAAWKDAQVEAAEATDRPSVRAWLEDVPIPERRPAYGALVAGADGAIWVGAYAPPGEVAASWDVFDAEGRWLATVTMPARFRLLAAAADRVLGVSRDALDVERVEVRPLSVPAG